MKMRVNMGRYRFTLLGFVFVVMFLSFEYYWRFDFFEQVVAFLADFEEYELDEYIIPVLVFGVFFFVDLLRRVRKAKVEEQKAEVYKATARSTQHVLNNFLNQVQLLKMIAEDAQALPPDIIKEFDASYEEAVNSVKSLSNVTEMTPEAIWKSVAPK